MKIHKQHHSLGETLKSYPLSLLLLNTVLEVPDNAIRQEKRLEMKK